MARYVTIAGVFCCALIGLQVNTALAGVPLGSPYTYNSWSEEFQTTSFANTKLGYMWTDYTGAPYKSAAVVVDGENLVLTSYSTGEPGALEHWGGCVGTGAAATPYNWQYGYFEAKIMMHDTPGHNMAFWSFPPDHYDYPTAADGNAVDVFNHYHTYPNNLYEQIEWNGWATEGCYITNTPTITDLEDTWHVYGLLWTPEKYEFYVDDQLKWSVTQTDAISHYPQPFIFVTQANSGKPLAGEIPEEGYGTLETSVTKMTVDYLRVYQVPEPSTFVMLAVGALALVGYGWRRRMK